MVTSAHLSFFGPPVICTSQGVIHLGRQRALALLAILALGRRTASRDGLCRLLWPHKERRKALASLSRMVNVLRGALGERVITGDRYQLTFDPDGQIQIDICALQIAVSKRDFAAMEKLTCGRRWEVLEGLSLCGENEFEQWIQGERMRGEALWCQALKLLAGETARRGVLDEALQWGQRWHAVDPYDESACAHLMAVYRCLGKLAHASSQFEIFRDRLVDELGLTPSNSLVEAYLRLGA